MKIVNGALLKVEQDDIKNGEFVVPDGIVDIESGAFRGCDSLERVQISDDVKTISGEAFAYCENLREVVFGENSLLRRIGNRAFDNCQSLENIVLPACLYEIGSHAFRNCTQLNTVDFEKNSEISIIGPYAFQNCFSLSSINLGRSGNLFAVLPSAFVECNSLSKIELPEMACLTEKGFISCPAEIIRTKAEKISLRDRIARASARSNNSSKAEKPRSHAGDNHLESLKYEF